jgi:hypothetical protein
MVETNKVEHIYIMENKDKYEYYKEDGEWILYIYDLEHNEGKFLTRSKFIDKILERIPS